MDNYIIPFHVTEIIYPCPTLYVGLAIFSITKTAGSSGLGTPRYIEYYY